MRASRWTGWAGFACLGLALACGGDEPAEPGAAAQAGVAPSGSAENQPPRIERLRFEPAEPMPGDTLRAVATLRDPDGDRVTQSYRWEISGRELPETGAAIELRGVAKGEEIVVWASASDGRAESEPAMASVTVANRRPVLDNVALQPLGSVVPGEPAVATPVAEDADGDSLEYRFRWTVNDTPVEDQEGESLPTQGLQPGDQIRVQVVASDGESESDAVWSGVLLVGNAAPQIVSTPSGVTAGAPFVYKVDARDPEGDRNLRYQLRKGPEGMTINPVLGEVRWQPRSEQTGVHPVEIAVEDSHGGRSVQVFELTVAQSASAPAASPPPAAPGE